MKTGGKTRIESAYPSAEGRKESAEVLHVRAILRSRLCEKNEKFIENTEVLFTKRDFRVTISFGLNRARR